jgi:selenocysteine lyase/cysteine desulfurase
MQALVNREEFICGDGVAYLYTPGEGLVPKSVAAAGEYYFKNKVNGVAGRQAHAAIAASARDQLCELMPGARRADIAFLGSSSEGINAVYDLVDWRAGDNVVLVTNDLEFPSIVLPAVKRKAQGITIRLVERAGWHVSEEAIADAVDGRTRLVFLSHVSYRTGFRLDLARLRQMLSESDALLAVDATQSLGVLPVPASACDFLVATTCKWLLGPHGLGVFYWNQDRRPDILPSSIGWYSVVDDLQFPYDLKPDAERFELGGPNMLGIYALEAGLRVLTELGIDAVARHALNLAAAARSELDSMGLLLMTPDDDERGSGIVAWEDRDCARTARAFSDHGVIVTGSSGRIRVGFHLYNDASDLERLLASISKA